MVNASQWYSALPIGTSFVAPCILWEIETCIVHAAGPLGDRVYMVQIVVA